MIAVMNEQKSRLHPYKFNMWIGLAGIIMMFAGLSSAYIVKRNQANWLTFDIPTIFWYSTALIVLSSVTIILSRKAFINRQMKQYQSWLGITTLLGIAFVTMQFFGFVELWNNGITITRNVSFSFLYVIVGVHALHVVGGIVVLIILYVKSLTKRTRVYNSLSIDLMSTYWHFVDLLWIYLLIFLVMIR